MFSNESSGELLSNYSISYSSPSYFIDKENVTNNFTTELLHNTYEDRLTLMREENNDLSVLGWFFLIIPSLLLVMGVIWCIVALIVKYCCGICNIRKCENFKPEDVFRLC